MDINEKLKQIKINRRKALWYGLTGSLGIVVIPSAYASHAPKTDITEDIGIFNRISVQNSTEIEEINPTNISNPPTGRTKLFLDIADDILKRKQPDGSIIDLANTDNFLLLDGSRPMTGNLDLDNNKLIFSRFDLLSSLSGAPKATFQSSITNEQTILQIKPNGSGVDSTLSLFGGSGVNVPKASFNISNNNLFIVGNREGTGTYATINFRARDTLASAFRDIISIAPKSGTPDIDIYQDSKVIFGGDTNIFRKSANLLGTNDNLQIEKPNPKLYLFEGGAGAKVSLWLDNVNDYFTVRDEISNTDRFKVKRTGGVEIVNGNLDLKTNLIKEIQQLQFDGGARINDDSGHIDMYSTQSAKWLRLYNQNRTSLIFQIGMDSGQIDSTIGRIRVGGNTGNGSRIVFGDKNGVAVSGDFVYDPSATNGMEGFVYDYSNGRVYWYGNGNVHYVTQTAGLEFGDRHKYCINCGEKFIKWDNTNFIIDHFKTDGSPHVIPIHIKCKEPIDNNKALIYWNLQESINETEYNKIMEDRERAKRETLIITEMDKDIEVTKNEALDQIEIENREFLTEKIYFTDEFGEFILDKDGNKIIESEIPIMIITDEFELNENTGEFKVKLKQDSKVISTKINYKLKDGYWIDNKLKKFYRKKTRSEAELAIPLGQISYTEYKIKQPPKWLSDRGVN